MHRRGLILVGLIIVLAAILFFSNRPDPEPKISSSQEAAAVQIDKAIQEGQPAWLFFRTSTCPSCVELKKSFDSLQAEYDGRVVFIDINLDEERNQELGREYRIGYVPQTYIIDANGEVTYQMVGDIPLTELRSELDRVSQ